MTRGLLIVLGLGASTAAMALDWNLLLDENDEVIYLITADQVPFSANGAGTPSVVYDRVADEFVMYYNVKYTPEFLAATGASWDHCIKAGQSNPVVWGVGRATSDDGLAWGEFEPVLIPEENTYYGCNMAHPTALFDEDAQQWHLWYKTSQDWDVCIDGNPEPTWGCDRITGIGHAQSDDGLNFEFDAVPAFNTSSTLGYPSVVKVDKDYDPESGLEPDYTWYMLFGLVPDIWLATSDTPAGPYAPNVDGEGVPAPVMTPGADTWIQDQVFIPSAVCEDDDTNFAFTMFMGGARLEGSSVVEGGWGSAVSQDAIDWYIAPNTPYFDWDNANEFRQWGAVRVGSDYVVYYVDKIDGMLNISAAYTLSDLGDMPTAGDFSNRVCPADYETDTDTDTDSDSDTDTDTDTDSDVDTDTDSDTDSDSDSDTDSDTGSAGGGGCNCNDDSEDASGLLLLGLLPLLGLARRRRR